MGAFTVYLSANDIAATPGEGKLISETSLANMFSILLTPNSAATSGAVYTGFSNAGQNGLTFTVASGIAVVIGRRIYMGSSEACTLTDNTINYVSLYLDVDSTTYKSEEAGILVSQSTYNSNSSGKLRYTLRLWKVTTSGGVISAAVDRRPTLLPNVNAPAW
jgi:hypothetical protein